MTYLSPPWEAHRGPEQRRPPAAVRLRRSPFGLFHGVWRCVGLSRTAPGRYLVELLYGYGAAVADSPDPDGPHEHLYHRHLLARARGRGPTEAAAVGVVGCVICGASTTIESATRRDVEQAPVAGPGGGVGGGSGREVLEPVGVERVQVVGYVEGLWAISQCGAWPVVVDGRVLFAREGEGCAQALRAAFEAGEAVRVAARRIRADLWADAVHRR